MTKQYCDCCGKEILHTSLPGAVMKTYRAFPFNPEDGPQTTGEIKQKISDLCEDCQKIVWKSFEDLKLKSKNKNEEQDGDTISL